MSELYRGWFYLSVPNSSLQSAMLFLFPCISSTVRRVCECVTQSRCSLSWHQWFMLHFDNMFIYSCFGKIFKVFTLSSPFLNSDSLRRRVRHREAVAPTTKWFLQTKQTLPINEWVRWRRSQQIITKQVADSKIHTCTTPGPGSRPLTSTVCIQR